MSNLVIPNTIGGARLAQPFNDNFASIMAWANGNIGADNLAANSVGSSELINGSVTNPKMATDSVGLTNLINGSVAMKKLGTDLMRAPVILSIDAVGLAHTANSTLPIPELSCASFTPAVNCYALISGCLVLTNSAAEGSSPTMGSCVYMSTAGAAPALLSNSTIKASRIPTVVGAVVPIPISHVVSLNANTAYYFRAGQFSSTASTTEAKAGSRLFVQLFPR